MSRVDPVQDRRVLDVPFWAVVDMVTWFVGLNLICALAGVGVPFVDLGPMPGHVLTGLVILVCCLVVVRTSRRIGQRRAENGAAGNHEATRNAGRGASFGNGHPVA